MADKPSLSGVALPLDATLPEEAARFGQVSALARRNPNDLGTCRRVQRTAQNVTSQTNTNVTFTHTLSSTEHASVLNTTTTRLLTAGLWLLTAAIQLGANAITNQGFWIGNPAFSTRYASEGGHAFAASTFPTLTLSVAIELPANTDVCSSVWLNGTSPATSPGYDLIHLAATLLRRTV